MKRRPAFLRRRGGAPLRVQLLGSGAPAAATAAAMAAASEPEGEAAGGLQKAAAWQWFMHGAGADAQAPHLHSSAAATKRSATRLTSRFAQEAARISVPSPRPPHLPLFDDVDLPGIAAIATKSHSLQHLLPSSRELLEKTIAPPRRRLRFHRLQRLLYKLILPKSADAFLIPPSPTTVSDSDDEMHHHYHHYIHHHHHHHFYLSDEAGFYLEELVIPGQPHSGSADRRRRRHSESAGFFDSQNYIYDDSGGESKHNQISLATVSAYL